MKHIVFLVIALISGSMHSSTQNSKVLCEGEECPKLSLKRSFERSVNRLRGESKAKEHLPKVSQNKSSRNPRYQPPSGNLPDYMRRSRPRAVVAAADMHVMNSKSVVERDKATKAGQTFEAVLEHGFSITEGTEVPVRALITSGKHRGARLLGTASFHEGLSRATIEFTTLNSKSRGIIALESVAVGQDSQYGLTGNIDDYETEYFLGELASATAAGVVDATVDRAQTNVGFIERPGVDTAAKKGVVTALSRSANRFAKKAESKRRRIYVHPNQRIIVMVTKTGELED